MSSAVSVALIGAGWIAERAYVPALRALPDLRLALVCDLLPGRAEQLASTIAGARASSEPMAALRAADAIIACTPPSEHAELLAAAIAAGKFVYCEKPVLRSRQELAQLGPRAGELLMGSATMRLRDDVAGWLACIGDGSIGRLVRVRASWHRQRGVPAPGTWRTTRSASPLGVLEDLGPHLLDIALGALDAAGLVPNERLLPQEQALECRGGALGGGAAAWFEPLNAGYDAPDWFRGVAQLAPECEIELSLRWIDREPGDLVQLEAVGTRGSARLEGLLGYSTSRRLPGQTLLLKREGAVQRREHIAGPEPQRRAFQASLERFASFCSGRSRPLSSARDIALVAGWLEDLSQPGSGRAGS
ncbi:MAG TPA: Gfo/Idh/MocA family oxidoreductase [Polyangiaceae bacterium]|nr:Gfo/Idh/MocA family oxidoreductase [Polyangiaceae bacterium]